MQRTQHNVNGILAENANLTPIGENMEQTQIEGLHTKSLTRTLQTCPGHKTRKD